MSFLSVIADVANILPEPPTGTPEEIAKIGLDFFEVWIGRVGGFVAFIGAIKLALAMKSEDSRDYLQAILIMVSGFMIKSAVSSLGVFSTTATNAETEFTAIMTFISGWTRRVGAFGLFLGAVMFGLAMKDNNATGKVTALKTLSAGAITAAVSALLTLFV